MGDLGRSLGMLFFAGSACLLLVGCQPAAVKTTTISGVVTVDGEPVSLGTIAFEPDNPSLPSATAEIHDGKFTIGSPRGKRRILIMAYRQAEGLGPDGQPYQEQYLPARFNLESDRFLEVESETLVDQNFELTLTN